MDLAEIRMFDGVGAEKFAKHAFDFADNLITDKTDGRCLVEVWNDANTEPTVPSTQEE